MLVKFDVPNNLKKNDLLIYNGEKFIVITRDQILKDVNFKVDQLENKVKLLEQRINKNIEDEIRRVIGK